MAAYPTGIAEVDALPVVVAKVIGDVGKTGESAVASTIDQMRETLLFLSVEACDNGTNLRPAFVVTVPTPEVIGTTVVAVSPDLLNILGYADKAAYQAALNESDFIHPADLLSVQSHVSHGIAAPYKARLKKADLSYQRMVVRGISLVYKGKTYRLSILRREGT